MMCMVICTCTPCTLYSRNTTEACSEYIDVRNQYTQLLQVRKCIDTWGLKWYEMHKQHLCECIGGVVGAPLYLSWTRAVPHTCTNAIIFAYLSCTCQGLDVAMHKHAHYYVASC